MDFSLDDEQRALAKTVREYLADRFGLDKVRAVFEDEDGDGNPAELWKAYGEQGWLAVTVPEEHDGLGLGILDAQVIARALGAGVAPGPWLGTVLAAEAIRLAGDTEQQKSWLPRLAAGEVIGAVSFDAPVKAGDGWALPRVEYGAIADIIITANGDQLWLSTSDKFNATPLAQYDGTSRLATVALTGSGEQLANGSAAVIADLKRRAAVLAAADLTGIARESITRTVAYDRERVQFGRPVGSFQAIKHSLADLHVAVTMSEHASLYAAYAIDADLPDVVQAVAVAKSKASDTGKLATQLMIQYLGGIGYTWEHEAHFFFKRAKRLAGSYGTAAEHRKVVSQLLLDRARTSTMTEPATAEGTPAGVA